MPDKVAVRIGSGGRVVIPKDYLREKGIKEGDIVLVSLSKAKVEEATGRDLSE
ncbi:MAG TPA: AbrB/MazE/SpoVT family DNA-binding domain-containing protein [Thermoplasmatales archaeon]|nr:AbrB/MazE/SpoVT family DNA-binding domain-containing protein [Thermoplasmatales archaeon]